MIEWLEERFIACFVLFRFMENLGRKMELEMLIVHFVVAGA